MLKKYKMATDRSNPMRDKITLLPDMNGYLACDLQSYRIWDNSRYAKVLPLIQMLSNDRLDEADATGNRFVF